MADLEALEAALDAATPGPWVASGTGVFRSSPGAVWMWVADTNLDDRCHGEEDAEFIATARQAVPELIATVRGLQLKLRAVEALADWSRSGVGRAIYAEDIDAALTEADGQEHPELLADDRRRKRG